MDRKFFIMGFVTAVVLVFGGFLWGVRLVLTPREHTIADFGLQRPDGQPLPVDVTAGKVVFLNLWATWCMPCVREFETIAQVERRFRDEVLFLMVSEEGPEVIGRFLQSKPYPFQFLRSSTGFQALGIGSLPVTYIFDRKGRLVQTRITPWTDAAKLEAELRALLAD